MISSFLLIATCKLFQLYSGNYRIAVVNFWTIYTFQCVAGCRSIDQSIIRPINTIDDSISVTVCLRSPLVREYISGHLI